MIHKKKKKKKERMAEQYCYHHSTLPYTQSTEELMPRQMAAGLQALCVLHTLLNLSQMIRKRKKEKKKKRKRKKEKKKGKRKEKG